MELIKCANPKCGKEFERHRKDNIYCSSNCYKHMYLLKKNPLKKIKCKNVKCGNFFVQTRKDKIYCCVACKNYNMGRRLWDRKRSLSKIDRDNTFIKCEHCDGLFSPKNTKRQRFCSRECFNRINMAQKNRRDVDNLKDIYVKKLLFRDSKSHPVNYNLIEQKRLQIKIKRKIKQIQNESRKNLTQ